MASAAAVNVIPGTVRNERDRTLVPAAPGGLLAAASLFSDSQLRRGIAGANSIFHGEKLLTTGNPDVAADEALFDRLGITPMPVPAPTPVW